jgi:hypothetical protein
MKYITLIFLFFFEASNAFGQSKWSLEGSFGFNINFFVQSYQEYGPIPNSVYLYKKNPLGTSSGMELKFKSGKNSSFFAGYNRTVNQGIKNLSDQRNGVSIDIINFNLHHINDLFIVGYERSLSKKLKNWKFNGGVGLLYPHLQEISIEQNSIIIEERDFKLYNLIEACVFGGVEYSRMVDRKFELGFRVRAFYVLTAGFMESITATPVLRYHF